MELPQDLTLTQSGTGLFSGPQQLPKLSCWTPTSTKPQPRSLSVGIKPSRSMWTLLDPDGLWGPAAYPRTCESCCLSPQCGTILVLSRPGKTCHGYLKGSHFDIASENCQLVVKISISWTLNWNLSHKIQKGTNIDSSQLHRCCSVSPAMYDCFCSIFGSGQWFLLTTGFLAVFYFYIKIAHFLGILSQ